MYVRKTETKDLSSLIALFDEARGTIAALGIDQWQNGYPNLEVAEEDVALSRSFVVTDGESLCGTFVLLTDGEVTYDKIYNGHWLSGDENKDYVAIHRVAVAVAFRGKGISDAMIDYAAEFAGKLARKSLRIDTHEGNIVMRRMLEKHDFKACGTIYLQSGAPRVAYEKVL